MLRYDWHKQTEMGGTNRTEISINQTESDLPHVNKPSEERYRELNLEWDKLNSTARLIIETDVPQYNKLLWEKGIGAIREIK